MAVNVNSPNLLKNGDDFTLSVDANPPGSFTVTVSVAGEDRAFALVLGTVLSLPKAFSHVIDVDLNAHWTVKDLELEDGDSGYTVKLSEVAPGTREATDSGKVI